MEPMTTERLILRSWRDSDYLPFFKINSDPDVMEFFPALLSHEESDEMATE
ncbi:MAG TPA: N-acetyltransferase, partial [Gammaproteobacteria bacterium]|nr:N-acetyltransferase [Gammaproteobacteria bacterium]